MSDREDIVDVLRRGVADLAGERPEPAEIREMLDGIPVEPLRRYRFGVLAAAAAVVVVVALAAFPPVPDERGAAAFDGIELPVLRVVPRGGFSKERYRATLVIREEDAELRLEYEPADGGSRERVRTRWEPLPVPAGAGEDDLPALRIVADGGAPWNRVQRLASPNMGSRTSFYLAGRGGAGGTLALPLLVKPPPAALRLGATVTPEDLGLAKHPGAFRAIRIERGRRQVYFAIGTVGAGVDPERYRLSAIFGIHEALIDSGMIEKSAMRHLGAQVTGMSRMPAPDGGGCVVLLLVSRTARVVDVLRAVELAGGDPAVRFWAGDYDRGVVSDGRGLARDLLRPFELRGREVVVSVPVADPLRVDLPGRKGVVCAPEKIPFPEQRFDRLVLHPLAATPWSRCRPAVLEARRRDAAVEFRFTFQRVLPVPPLRGGQKPVEVRIGLTEHGAPICTPGEKELIGKDIAVTACEEATAEDVFRTVQFLLWRGVAGVDFR